RRLPVLGEAMLEGVLDEPRAVAFIRWTSGLTDAAAARTRELRHGGHPLPVKFKITPGPAS
ncbi:hypothetical protein, partial [Microbispora sp. CSR-4]|uniref:hypothetical protein n=1 Tax=Microbispora sp. CSR-4 TaxID=2592813 RepID=UPI001C9C576C